MAFRFDGDDAGHGIFPNLMTWHPPRTASVGSVNEVYTCKAVFRSHLAAYTVAVNVIPTQGADLWA